MIFNVIVSIPLEWSNSAMLERVSVLMLKVADGMLVLYYIRCLPQPVAVAAAPQF